MKITAISDLHGETPDLPGGDLLIVAGDCTAMDKIVQWGHFFTWFKAQNYEKKILIAGNHDNFLFNAYPKSLDQAKDCAELDEFLMSDISKTDFEYLCDSGTEYGGLHIWGSPWTSLFHGVNPNCKAFMINGRKLKKKWDLIPSETDILITHSPPFGIFDESHRNGRTGCPHLKKKILSLKPILCVYGHIHEHGGQTIKDETTVYANCAYMDRDYEPTNKIVNLEISGERDVNRITTA